MFVIILYGNDTDKHAIGQHYVILFLAAERIFWFLKFIGYSDQEDCTCCQTGCLNGLHISVKVRANLNHYARTGVSHIAITDLMRSVSCNR